MYNLENNLKTEEKKEVKLKKKKQKASGPETTEKKANMQVNESQQRERMEKQ